MTDKATEIAEIARPDGGVAGRRTVGAEYLPSPGGAVLRLYIDVPADE